MMMMSILFTTPMSPSRPCKWWIGRHYAFRYATTCRSPYEVCFTSSSRRADYCRAHARRLMGPAGRQSPPCLAPARSAFQRALADRRAQHHILPPRRRRAIWRILLYCYLSQADGDDYRRFQCASDSFTTASWHKHGPRRAARRANSRHFRCPQ